MKKVSSRIVSDPGILCGKPVVKGTRMSVEFILEVLSSGLTVKDLIKEYPQLKAEDVYAAIGYAARSLKHEDIIFPVSSS